MSFTAKANTLDDLLNKVYKKILKNGLPVKGNDKGDNKEILGVTLELKNPLARVSRSELKGTIFSCLGELSWYLSGSNKVDFIDYYISGYSQFSDDDVTIYGAYGPRLMAKSSTQTSQLDKIIDMLTHKKSTRKAVIQIFQKEDTEKKHKDVPCTTNLQFFIRKNKLVLITHMRSNDAYRGLPHDIFSFTMIQEYVARKLNLELGSYIHVANSLHVYETDISKIKDYILEGIFPSNSVMLSMPVLELDNNIKTFLKIEEDIRLGTILTLDDIKPLPKYWHDLVILLLVYKFRNDSNALVTFMGSINNRQFDIYINKRIDRLPNPQNSQLELPTTSYTDLFFQLCNITDDCSRETCSDKFIQWSMPIPYFGNILKSRVATVGINPSNIEFIDRNGQPYEIEQSRFETLKSLPISKWKNITPQIAEKLIRSCDYYFLKNPYKIWFTPLERLCSESIGSSYYDSNDFISMSHIDIVPFATKDKWSSLPSELKKKLISVSKNFLLWQIVNSKLDFLILNGSSVIGEFEKASSTCFKKEYSDNLSIIRKNGSVVKGYYVDEVVTFNFENKYRKLRVFGFNHNLQSSFGVSNGLKNEISKILKGVYE